MMLILYNKKIYNDKKILKLKENVLKDLLYFYGLFC